MGANSSSNARKSGDKNPLLRNDEDKTTKEQNKNTLSEQKETETQLCQPSKDKPKVEKDICRKFEENDLQDGAQASEIKTIASSDATEKLQLDISDSIYWTYPKLHNSGTPSATTKSSMDHGLDDIVKENDVIVSFPSTTSVESKDISHYVADEHEYKKNDDCGGIGHAYRQSASDLVSDGSGCIRHADCKGPADLGGDDSGTSGHESQKEACDGLDDDSGSTSLVDGQGVSDRDGNDSGSTRSAKGKGTCSLSVLDSGRTAHAYSKTTCDGIDDCSGSIPSTNGQVFSDRRSLSTGKTAPANGKIDFTSVGDGSETSGPTTDHKHASSCGGDGSGGIGLVIGQDNNDPFANAIGDICLDGDKDACDHVDDDCGTSELIDDKDPSVRSGARLVDVQCTYTCDHGGDISGSIRHAGGGDALDGVGNGSDTSGPVDIKDAPGCGGNGIRDIGPADVQDAVDRLGDSV
ncbi:hypothetical protein ACROYT_G032225 [Oculina patagonica]